MKSKIILKCIIIVTFVIVNKTLYSQHYYDNQTGCAVSVILNVYDNTTAVCNSQSGFVLGSFASGTIPTGTCTSVSNIEIIVVTVDGITPSNSVISDILNNPSQQTILTPSPCPCPATTIEYDPGIFTFIFQ